MPEFITRFAPSPTGYLHLGHAYAARCAFGAAARENGICLVRIEDTDQTRCRPQFEAAILEDLAWLGFDWPQPVRRQSEHLPAYEQALTTLIDRRLVYRCFRTRKEIAAQSAFAPHDAVSGVLNGEAAFTGMPLAPDEEAEKLGANEPFAWRLSMSRCRDHLSADWSRLAFEEQGAGPDGQSGMIAAKPALFGDVIIARKDTATSYHLACVHDDALQGISHVVRGNDLFPVTHLHVLLQHLLGLPTPIYRHHPLLPGPDGKRLSKRNGAAAIRTLRDQGVTREEIRTRTGNFQADGQG